MVRTTAAARDRLAAGGEDALHPAVAVEDQILDRRGVNFEVRLGRQQGLHGAFVEAPVGLGARPPDGGPLAAVEDAELDAGAVDGASHEAVQGVDLAHQLSLGQAADGRVARHLADGLEAMGQKDGAPPHAGRRRRRLAAGVATADDDDVDPSHGANLGSSRGQVKPSG